MEHSGCAAWPVDERPQIRVPKTQARVHDAEVCKRSACAARTRGGGTESPQAAAKPMMARVRKWTARCLSATVVSFFCLVRVSVFCSILTWNVPNLLCRAKRPWSCAEGGRGAGRAWNWAAGRRVRRKAWVLGYKGSSSQRGIWLWGLAEARRSQPVSQCTDKGWERVWRAREGVEGKALVSPR